MNFECKVKLIENLVNMEKLRKKIVDDLIDIGFNFEIPMIENWNAEFGNIVNDVAESVGDNYNWINWFIYDNECGANRMTISNDGETEIEIETVKDLVKYCIQSD